MSEELAVVSSIEQKTRSIDTISITARIKQLLNVLGSWVQGLPLVFAFFAVWETLPRLGVIDPLFLPTFSATISTLIDLTLSGKMLLHIAASLQRAVIGFSLALLVAVPLGFLMGWYNKFERYTDLLVQGLRNTSTFAL